MLRVAAEDFNLAISGGSTWTRRQALAAWTAGLSSTLLWPDRLRAAATPIPTVSFIVVSDTHLGRDGFPGAPGLWRAAAREIDAAAGDLVLHLGDIVDQAREPQYEVYRRIRDTMRKPIHEIPGNHDPPELFARHIRRAIDTAFDHRGIRFVLINNSRYGEIHGFMTPAQLRWMAEQFEDASRRGLWLVLAMHVPAHVNRFPDSGAHVRPEHGQKQLYELLDRHRDRVLLLLHGHFHCGLRGWNDLGPWHEIVFPSALYNRNQFLAELKAPGYHLSEFRPSFTTVTLEAKGVTLRCKPVGAEAAQQMKLTIRTGC